jgi:hypothetical protein
VKVFLNLHFLFGFINLGESFPEFPFFIRLGTKSIPRISRKFIDSFVKLGLVKAVLKYVKEFLFVIRNAVSSRHLQLIRSHALHIPRTSTNATCSPVYRWALAHPGVFLDFRTGSKF